MSDSQPQPILDEIEDELSDEEEEKRPYYFQLDVLKAIAIIFVVMDHSLTWAVKGAIGSLFWERLSIPFFLIVMGFNMGYSFRYSGASRLRDFYTFDYFKKKFVRYVFPFLVLYMGSILLGLYYGYIDTGPDLLLGYLPFWGPGNWFIPMLFGSIIVFPVVYWAFKKQRILTMILCFLSEIALQLILTIYFPNPYASRLVFFFVTAIRVNILFFLPAVALGLWFSEGHDLFAMRNWFVPVYAVISFIFMVDYTTHIIQNSPTILGQSFALIDTIFHGDYTLLFYGYAAFFVLIAMKKLPQKAYGTISTFVQKIGRASYHILLFQIFWMSNVYWNTSHEATYIHEIPEFAAIFGWTTPLMYIPFYLMNLTISLTGGLIWYEAEQRANSHGKPWWQHVWMRRTYYLFGAFMSFILMGTLIDIVSEISGLNAWQREHGPYFILNEFTGPGFMANFIVILFCIGLSMTLMYKAFTMDDESIPI